MKHLALRCLGRFEARVGSGSPVGFPTRKAKALLAYLGRHPGRRASRDRVGALLWKGCGEERAYFSDGITNDIITELSRFRFNDLAMSLSALAETEGAEIVTADRALWRRMVARPPGLQAHWIADKVPRVH